VVLGRNNSFFIQRDCLCPNPFGPRVGLLAAYGGAAAVRAEGDAAIVTLRGIF
jgi:hypothetical protein